MRTDNLKRQIMVPLASALGVLLASFLVVFFYFQRDHAASSVAAGLQSVEDALEMQLGSDGDAMETALRAIRPGSPNKGFLWQRGPKPLPGQRGDLGRQAHVDGGTSPISFTGPERGAFSRLPLAIAHERGGDKKRDLQPGGRTRTRGIDAPGYLAPIWSGTAPRIRGMGRGCREYPPQAAKSIRCRDLRFHRKERPGPKGL